MKVKKSKDRERRRSIIQTITGLFSSSKKEETPKDPEAEKSKKSSPSKFQLPKFSPKKDKSKVFSNIKCFMRLYLSRLISRKNMRWTTLWKMEDSAPLVPPCLLSTVIVKKKG